MGILDWVLKPTEEEKERREKGRQAEEHGREIGREHKERDERREEGVDRAAKFTGGYKKETGGGLGSKVKGVFYKEETPEEKEREKGLKLTEEMAYRKQLGEERAKIGRARARTTYSEGEVYQTAKEKEMKRLGRQTAKAKYGFDKARLKEIRKQAKLAAKRSMRTGRVTKESEDRYIFGDQPDRETKDSFGLPTAFGLGMADITREGGESPLDLAGGDALQRQMFKEEKLAGGKSKPTPDLDDRLMGDMFEGMMGKNRWQMNPLDLANPFYKTRKQRKGGR